MGLIFAVTLAVALSLMFIGNEMRAQQAQQKADAQNYSEWLAENCHCTAYNIISCPTGFELQNQTCMNTLKTAYTSKLLGCSKYNCSGEIKNWNNQTEKWEN